MRPGLGSPWPQLCSQPPLQAEAHLVSPRTSGTYQTEDAGSACSLLAVTLALGWEGVEVFVRSSPGTEAWQCEALPAGCTHLLVPGRVLHALTQHLSLPGASGLTVNSALFFTMLPWKLNSCPGRVRKPWVGSQGHPPHLRGLNTLPIPF